MTDLLSCPFCGGAPEEHWPNSTTKHFIQCGGCGARTSINLASHGGSARDEWNRRVPVSALPGATAKLLRHTMSSDVKIPEALRELDEYLGAIGGCSDGYCIIVKPKGMHTNGGCRCAEDRMKMQRFAYAHNRFAAAIRSLGEKT